MLQLQVIGYVGRDAIISEHDGKSVINFSIATTKRVKAGDQETEVTHWVSCAYWTQKTKVAEFMKKGTMVYVQGELNVYLYDDSVGQKRYDIHCTVSKLELLTSKEKGNEKTNP